MMHHTSCLGHGKDAYCIGTVITPPLPKDSLCIDFDTTCFDACLSSDLMCKKCKALIGVHEHFNLSCYQHKILVRTPFDTSDKCHFVQ
jgi:hypothetical protein